MLLFLPPPGGGQVKRSLPLIAGDLRACLHLPSIPDSKADQAQAKTLLRTLGYEGGKSLGLGRGAGEGRRSEDAPGGRPNSSLGHLSSGGFRMLVLNCSYLL